MPDSNAQHQGSVAFFGGGALGAPCLRELARRGWIHVVVSQPDRPAGRGQASAPTPISCVAEELGLDLVRAPEVNHERVLARCERARMIVVISFGQKLPQELIAGRAAVNLHPSDLPRWRGAAPIQRAMMDGQERVTACAMEVSERMDAGAIYARQQFAVGHTETAGELHDRIALESVDMMMRTIERALGGSLVGEMQREDFASRAPKLSKAEAFVDFTLSARMVRCRIHGLAPWPGCDAEIEGEPIRLLKVREASMGMDGSTGQPVPPQGALGHPGEITRGGLVSCGEGAIEILQVQPVGRRAMDWASFCRGRSIHAGQRITSSPRKSPP